jgi:hypothetical protein
MFIALQENYFSDGKEQLSFDFFYWKQIFEDILSFTRAQYCVQYS